MEISARQLRRLVSEVDDRHRAEMSTFTDEQRELINQSFSAPPRRTFLRNAAFGGAALTLGSAVLPFGRLLAPAAAQELTEADIAEFAASLEFAAVAAYGAAGKTGKLSQPVLEAGTTFAAHHQEHGDAFAAFVKKDVPANQTVLDTFGPMIANAKSEKEIVQIAFDVENAAASTYLFALGVLENPDAVGAVASILPVEAQHAVVLGSVLGKKVDDPDLMPAFEPTDKALAPGDFPISG